MHVDHDAAVAAHCCRLHKGMPDACQVPPKLLAVNGAHQCHGCELQA